MAEVQMKFSGWQAIAVLVAVIVAVGLRMMTLSDKTGDESLMRQIEVLLMSEYYPELAARLKAAHQTGDPTLLAQAAESVTSSKVNIISVTASAPPFDFSSPQKVIVKVIYSLDDAAGAGQPRTVYYRFKHGALGNNWQYQYESGVVSYYLNFL